MSNRRYDGIGGNNRERAVPAGTKKGDFLIVNKRPAVAVTERGGDDIVSTIGNVSITQTANTNAEGAATLAYDGTYEFPVTGVTTATGQDVQVFYIAGSGGDPATLSLTKGASGIAFGTTDFPPGYAKTAGVAPVQIGVVLPE